MKLLLRSNSFFVQSYKYQRLVLIPPTEEEKRRELEKLRQFYDGEEPSQEALQKRAKLDNQKLFDERAEERSFDDLGHQLSWETAAPHLMVQGYRYLEPINRTQLAKQKLRKYEASLQQPIEKIIDDRLISEKYVKRRQAELYLHRMAPLTSIFLDQGVNFLSAHVFAKLIQDERPSILKEFLNKGSFQAADFIDGEFLREYLPHFIDNPRQYFLLNVLSFEKNLLKGTVGAQQKEHYQIIDEGEEKGELPCLLNFNIGWRYLIKKCMSIIDSNETEFNRLRIYWGIQKLYDPEESYLRNILSQLSYVTLKVDASLQGEVNKEMRYIFISAYSKKPFLAFIVNIINKQKTFHDFITVYTLTIIALSKLRTITKLLPESKSNELHPIFQLIEFNLPKQSHQTFILAILKLLSHEDHSRIQFENFKRSYNYWLKDYTQPETTKYHSAISKLLEVNEDSLTIRYERNAKCPQYATFSHKLSRNKKPKKENSYIGQKEAIKHLLKKDYQPVLNQFITTFSLSSNRQLSQKFHKEMQAIDKKLQFKNKNEQALYKLKVAQNLFFHASLPNPLSFDKLKQYKKGFDSLITITDYPISSFDYTQQFDAYTKFEMLNFLLQEDKSQTLSDEANMMRAEGEMAGEVVEVKGYEDIEGEELGEEVIEAVEPTEEQLAAEPFLEEQSSEIQAAKATNTKSEDDRDLIQALVVDILFQGQQKYAAILQNIDQMIQDNQPQVKLFNYKRDIPNQDLYQLFFMDDTEPGTEDAKRFDKDAIFDYYEENLECESEGEKTKKVEVQEKPVFFKKKKKVFEEKELRADEFFEKDHERKLSKSEYQAKKMFGNKKHKFQFCTTQTVPTTENVTPVFNIDLMNQYRRKEVNKHFLTALQNEEHVSTVNSGSSVAKYLFLHGKNQNSKFVALPNKTLNIEFTSVIGTRAKNYERYVQKNLFRYALPSQFYEQLLVQQEKKYNRFEFKQIVAHLVHYNDLISDYAIDAICKVCEKQRIGYTFVEIAHLIKANNIKVSSQSLESITNVWQKFDIINQDLLPFLKDYCRKMQIPFKTQFYAQFCKGLIKTKGYEKLEVIANTIFTEIKSKPFKIDSSMTSMKADQVAVLEKEWKAKEQENYLRLYLELIEVIIKNLDNFVPQYLAEYFEDYRKMKPELNERELGYAFVCFAHKREKIEELLEKLDKQPQKGTSFMYDCLLQTILSNFEPLQDLSEKMLDVSVLKNRIALSNPQILKSTTVFKKSSSSNSFSKFLDHCLRFQHTIHESHEIKKEMFYVLNSNVQDVSVGGIFNLLDFIFNEKREKERIEYRAVKLSEEEKSKKLQEIQQSITKLATAAPKKEEKAGAVKKEGKKKGKKVEEEVEKPEPAVVQAESAKKQEKKEDDAQKKSSTKQDKKKEKKEKASERERQNSLLDQILAEQQAKSLPQSVKGSSDQEFIQMIKGQTKKHESTKRKSLQSMSTLFQGSLQLIREQEATRAKQAEKKTEAKKETQQKKDKKKGRK